ncbi:MAG: TIGR00730 family Rossman fold protein, partial [Actinobacteria bacterium]|nr:TIGR00730 family Rossman fold protein [Actinomycetota bacterium]
ETWLRNRVMAEGKISSTDLDLFHVVDDPEEVVARIRRETAGR